MRIVIDYRPALRERTGAGEYVHELVRALAAQAPRDEELTIFSSSWRDRLARLTLAELAHVRAVDRRIPVRLLNFAWHRLEWPPVELLAGGPCDVAHSMHPLLMPAARAAQVITIHDLHFLDRPDHVSAEIGRDYGALVREHAGRADMIVVSSHYTGRNVRKRLEVAHDRIAVCRPGPPAWTADVAGRPKSPEFLLFLGTIEPRKNIGALLDAYASLLANGPAPPLHLAGRVDRAAPAVGGWLQRIHAPPLAGHVVVRGYVAAAERPDLFRRARALVLPSLDEGFGLPALEAMACGVPVVAANRGALPEVLGDAGLLVQPEDAPAFAAALQRVIDDAAVSGACIARGLLRAREFSWAAAASSMRQAYAAAVQARRLRDR